MPRRPATATCPESSKPPITRLPSFHDQAPPYFPRRPRSVSSEAAIGPRASTSASAAATNGAVAVRSAVLPVRVRVHAPTEQRVQRGRQQTRRVTGVLEQLVALVRELVERGDGVGAEPRERGHVLRAHEHVDRVDLERRARARRRAGRRQCRRGASAAPTEALRREREPTRLARRQLGRTTPYDRNVARP